MKKIVIYCNDSAAENLLSLLHHFQSMGAIGCTRDFEIDNRLYTFDGDGPDRISKIDVFDLAKTDAHLTFRG